MRLRKKANYYPLQIIFPALCIYFVFYLGSIIIGFVLSFTDWNLSVSGIHFIGLDQFKRIIGERNVLTSICNTMIFTLICVVFKTLLGTIIAFVLDMSFKARNFFRAIFFLPCIFSSLVIGYVFNFILKGNGVFNVLLTSIGLGSITRDWLSDFDMALYTVAGIETWMWVGFCATIILAGLQSVPTELIESARIDGAGVLKIIRNIKLPFIMAALNVIVLLNLIGGLRVFDIIMATTNGGPGGATEVMSTFMFKAQGLGDVGYAAAIGFIQFGFIMVITTAINTAMRKMEVEL